jgi:WS/DGAT/MGAT family acyltransferase
MTLRRLSGLDTAFLVAERPGKYLHVMAILILDPDTVPGGYSFEGFRKFVMDQLPLVPPLRRRLLEVPFALARPVWAEDPDFQIDHHLRRAAVPKPGTLRELCEMAAEIEERPLDRGRPLWEMVVVEGLRDGHIAVLAKLHHSMMDGMAGLRYMASLFTRDPDLPEPACVDAKPPDPLPGALDLLSAALPSIAGRPLQAARAGAHTARLLAADAWRRVTDRSASDEADAPPRVERSPLNGPISPYRTIACAPLPLARIRAVARAGTATINDVILAVVAGALRSFLERRGSPPPAPLVAAVPVSTHAEGDDVANAISLFRVGLATDEEDPQARLEAIRDATQHAKGRGRSKGTGSGGLAGNIMEWSDVPAPLFFSLATQLYSEIANRLPPLCNLVVSSVPGPPVPLHLGGARLIGLYPLGPIYEGMALNVTALTCQDSVDVGLVACRRALPDLPELESALEAALDDLEASLLPGPGAAQSIASERQ